MYELTLLEDMSSGMDSYNGYCRKLKLNHINECPICNKNILPNMICDLILDEKLYLIFSCPSCEEIFMAFYKLGRDRKTGDNRFKLEEIFPKMVVSSEFEKEICDISPMFVEVYNQSRQAEIYNLNEISGMGYRKALEYLIKDYIIKNNSEKEEEVKAELLGNCIKNMVDNPKIKKMAKGAAWLGNDETHYIRRWEDKDIEDLKALINITVYWIMYELKTKEYEEIMRL